MIKNTLILFLFFCFCYNAQDKESYTDFSKSGWFSLGARSTVSSFSDEGNGLGTGGQFRIQMANSINTDWFFDYISINVDDIVRSEYYHIGWSVVYYPFFKKDFSKIVNPFILAGHCFDYNRMIAIDLPSISKDRWGSAVQFGLGFNYNLTKRFDITLMSQYMIHFTETLHAENDDNQILISSRKENTLQGHLLTTISLNYKIFRIWKKLN